jgi:hypothetical protein
MKNLIRASLLEAENSVAQTKVPVILVSRESFPLAISATMTLLGPRAARARTGRSTEEQRRARFQESFDFFVSRAEGDSMQNLHESSALGFAPVRPLRPRFHETSVTIALHH